jgi:hypothetical protein
MPAHYAADRHRLLLYRARLSDLVEWLECARSCWMHGASEPFNICRIVVLVTRRRTDTGLEWKNAYTRYRNKLAFQ